MRVELDLFSGRPNPSWDLCPAEADAVRGTLAALPDAPGDAPGPYSGLGYRGFRVTEADAGRSLVVWHDVVLIDGGASRLAKADAGRDLERFLLGTARTRLDPALYAAVLAQI